MTTLGVLATMSEAMREADIEPIVDVTDQDVQNMFVLAWDELLPPHIELAPKTMALAVTGGISMQRLFASKAISEARLKKSRRAGTGPMVDVGASRMDAPPPEPERPMASDIPDKAPETALATIQQVKVVELGPNGLPKRYRG